MSFLSALFGRRPVVTPPAEGRWVTERPLARWSDGVRPAWPVVEARTRIEHLDGVSWHQAPVPPTRHDCASQTRGHINYFTPVFRCACGAISSDGAFWVERNTRTPKEG